VRFETTLGHQPFLLGATPVHADFLLFGVLGNRTFKDWNRLSPEQSAIATWRERIAVWRLAANVA
jgi:glutathione S-transferase